jgi:hypothetical protein
MISTEVASLAAHNTGQIPPGRLQSHWRRSLGNGQAVFGRPVKPSPKPADIPESIEDLPDSIPVANGKQATRRKHIKSSTHEEEHFERKQSEDDDGDQDVVQPSIKFASLKEQSLFYGDIPDNDPISTIMT